ncbi:ABC transporter ATP-binding protein [Sporolactobacillus sp. THM7-4]|nr:ABC transporter ATP-binding protein [Sporolactobacillus sp. THM7-4]
MKELIEINNLVVQKDNRKIIDFQGKHIVINEGDKVALLGENGAGKTTLINAILDDINYEGEIKRNFKKKDIGIVFQENDYSDLIRVNELIDLVIGIKGEQLNSFLNEFSLKSLYKSYVKDLSVGEQQRLTLALVLYRQATVYLFDELTSGLDYQKREQLLETIRNRTQNNTVITITHYFEEIEKWANKIIILKEGSILFYGEQSLLFHDFPHFSLVQTSCSINSLEKLKDDYNLHIIDLSTPRLTKYGIICNSKECHQKVTDYLIGNNIEHSLCYQNIYTCYIVACERNKIR